MKLVDTSVLVAAALEADPRFEVSNRFLERQTPASCAASSHTLVETYSSLTRLPAGLRLTPRQASAFIANWARELRIVSLEADEVLALIAGAPERGVAGGRVYDAVHARAALKAGAKTIVTWNGKHFIGLEPALKIETPERSRGA